MEIVIIGAGQTGRGLIAPIMKNNGFSIAFIDKNRSLVETLNKEKSYSVAYFGNIKAPIDISGYTAFHVDDPRAIQAIAEADIVTTSVFANQIASLIPLFREAIAKRIKEKRLMVACIENGVNVKKPLLDAGIDADITEGIIFCTSIKDPFSLRITSEADIDVPIDAAHVDSDVNIAGMPLEKKFDDLIQRKIYTYNFISAAVAYLGSYRNYESYAQAANDPTIRQCIASTLPHLNRFIADEFNISYAAQSAFSDQAVRKFENQEIADSIERNAQQAKRKLGYNERLITPLRLAIENHGETRFFALVIAAALHYGQRFESLDVKQAIIEIAEKIDNEPATHAIRQHYQSFADCIPLETMVGANQ